MEEWNKMLYTFPPSRLQPSTPSENNWCTEKTSGTWTKARIQLFTFLSYVGKFRFHVLNMTYLHWYLSFRFCWGYENQNVNNVCLSHFCEINLLIKFLLQSDEIFFLNLLCLWVTSPGSPLQWSPSLRSSRYYGRLFFRAKRPYIFLWEYPVNAVSPSAL